MTTSMVPDNELERLNILYSFGLIGLGKMPELDVFAEIACRITECPTSIIAIMEKDSQRIQSCIGIDLDMVDRKNTVCQYTLMGSNPLMIEDTFEDPRTSSNPLIQAGHIRFYAGVPLLDDRGYALGTLCVVDYHTNILTDTQLTELEKLAQAVVTVLLAKRKQNQASYFKEILSVTQNMICVLNEDFSIKEISPAFADSFDKPVKDLLEEGFFELLNITDQQLLTKLKSVKTNADEVQVKTVSILNDDNKIIIDWHLKHNKENKEIFAFGRNITKENAEKIKLEISERKFRNFFENGIGLMSMHDLDGNILEVNEKGRKALGYDLAEVTGLNLRDLVPEVNQYQINPYLERIETLGEDSGMMVMKHKNGEWIYWLYNNMLEKDPQGRQYVVSTALNLTERIELEKDLLTTKQILEQTSAVAQVGGWEADLANNKIFWSGSTRNIHGVSKDFIPTMENVFSFFDPVDSEFLAQSFQNAVNTGEPYDFELKLHKPNNENIWVRIKGIPEFIDGKCDRVFGIIQDIDQSKNLYLDLGMQEAMLQTFVNHVPASVAMFGNDMNVLALSQQWKDEFNQHNISDKKHLYDLFPEVPAYRKEIYSKALEGIPYKNTNEIIHIKGKQDQNYHWEVRPWRVSDESVGGFIIFFQNITDQVLKNEELKNAKKLADLASKAKSEFLANMSHEIRTPLNGVIGFSDLLLKTPLNELQKQYLKYVNESGNNLLSIINDILDFSKIESGKLEFHIDRYNLYEIVNQVIHVILYQAQNKGIELLLNIEQGIPAFIFIDETRIKQILINLLGNAVKFTESGEIELRVAQTKKDDENLGLKFSVRDTGIGIPDEKQQKIFDAFMQEDSSVSKKFGGTGLGLTISNNILKYMGSELTLKSTVSVGSEFSFEIEVPYELPFHPENDLVIDSALIVDDNSTNRLIIEHMLGYKGVETTSASNGFEAIQLLATGKRFDAIIMDYRMPILNGLETIAKIKELFQQNAEQYPIFVLSTSSEDQQYINLFRQEPNSYCLPKPIISEELYRILSQPNLDVSIPIEDKIEENDDEQQIFNEVYDVLIADDNTVNMALNIRLTEEILPNCRIINVENGFLAVEACKKKQFDLILMDIQMPVMDGLEATKKIKLMPAFQEIPIIGITAGNVVGERERCLQAGITEFLTKPVKAKDFKEIVHKSIIKSVFSVSVEEPEKQHIDFDKLDEATDYDADFKKEFVGLIIHELQLQEMSINQVIEEQDTDLLKRTLHKLKGTSSTSGLVELNQLVLQIDNEYSNEIPVSEKLKDLLNEIEILLKLLNEIK